jgi:hypothetical protein
MNAEMAEAARVLAEVAAAEATVAAAAEVTAPSGPGEVADEDDLGGHTWQDLHSELETQGYETAAQEKTRTDARTFDMVCSPCQKGQY